MSYANILVSVDLSEASAARVRLAAGLAGRFEAVLTGAAARKIPSPVLVHDIYDAQAQEDENRAAVQAELRKAHETFLGNIEDDERTEWRPAFAGPITHVVALARAADLVILGQPGAASEEGIDLVAPPGPILMEAGRPVLVVPPQIDRLRAARIVIAWKDTVEARRAVTGALSFIRHADQVFIASVGEGARFEGTEEMAAYLARHGAAVTAHLLAQTTGAADEILDFARRQDADLIVMGGYGHSRLREWVFGGVTQDILRRSPICVLMSH